MKRIALLGLAIVAVFAMTALNASAKKAGLILHTAKITELKAGAEISASSKNLTFTTEKGALECTVNILGGKLGNNNSSKDKGTVESDIEEGTETVGSEHNLCKTALGPAKIHSLKFPWTDEFGSTGKYATKGKKITFTSTFPGLGGVMCVFEAATVKGTNTTTGKLEITISKQKFKANKKLSNEACPKEGTLSGVFNEITSGGESVEA